MEDLTTFQKFRELAEVGCKSKATIKKYEVFIKEFIEFYGEKPKQDNIIHYLHYLRTKRKYDKSSICIARSAIKYYYEEVLDEPITIKLPKIKRRRSLPKPLPKELIKKIMQNIKNLKHRLLIEMAYDGGFRPNELVKLKWENVDWEQNTIQIDRGKGDKDRPTFLSDNVMQHLRDYKATQNKNNPNCKYIFDSMYRPQTHICKRTFQQILKNVAKKIGLDRKVFPYSIRHSFATHLKEKGVPIEDIQPRMGHSHIKTTMIYAKVVYPKEKPITLMDDEYFQ